MPAMAETLPPHCGWQQSWREIGQRTGSSSMTPAPWRTFIDGEIRQSAAENEQRIMHKDMECRQLPDSRLTRASATPAFAARCRHGAFRQCH